MKSETSVSIIMTKEVITLDINDSLTEAERIFGNHSLRHAPVLKGGQLVGMLSLVDLRRSLEFEENLVPPKRRVHVGQLMSVDPVSVQVDKTIREVAHLFLEDEFHAVPVLDGQRVVGIVSTTDVIRFLLDNMEAEE